MARFNRRFSRRKASLIPPEKWPMNTGVQLVLDTDGTGHPKLHDDCPICRGLRESGEQVFTLDLFGNLVPVSQD